MGKNEVTVGQLCNRFYKKVGTNVEPVSPKSVLEGISQDWFQELDRNPFPKTTCELLGIDISSFPHFENMNYSRFIECVENMGDEKTAKEAFSIMQHLHNVVIKKMMDMYVELGLVENIEEVGYLFSKYIPYMSYGRLNTVGQEHNEELVTFVIMCVILYLNYVDIFGEALAKNMDYFNGSVIMIPSTTIIPEKWLSRVLKIVSSNEIMILDGNKNYLKSTSETNSINKCMETIRKLEESYNSSVMIMNSSNFRPSIIESFVGLNTAKESSVRGSFAEVFVLMRTGVGDALIRKFHEHLSAKTQTRKIIESILIEWWVEYKNDRLISLTKAIKRVEEFMKHNAHSGISVEPKGLISPSIYRVYFKNEGVSPDVFARKVSSFENTVENKVSPASNVHSLNKLEIEQNFVRIVDIKVRP